MKCGLVASMLPLLALGAGPASRPAATTRPTYECVRVPTPINIDGKLDDWSAVAWTSDFVTLRGKTDVYRTRAKLAWDERYLYVAGELQSAHVRATQKKHDAILYTTDPVFELFLDPDGDSKDYVELEVNALNATMDLLMSRPYNAGGNYDLAFELPGLKSAVSVDGTANRSSDQDRGWTVELAIPWAALSKIAHRPCPPGAGDGWRVQLARSEPAATPNPDGTYALPAKPRYHFSVWSPQPTNTFHAPGDWGDVRFVASRPATDPR